jgi:hypothetical protein
MSNGGAAIAFGGIGSLIGLVIGVIIEFASPDGFTCFAMTSDLTKTAPVLQSMFSCWIVVLLSAGILGAIGTAIGALVSSVGGN